MSEVVEFLRQHVTVDDQVVQNIIQEQIDLTSFYLLDESDLKDLGFPLGPRKVLFSIIKQHRMETTEMLSLPSVSIESGASGTTTPSSGGAPSTPRSSAGEASTSTEQSLHGRGSSASSAQHMAYDVHSLLCQATRGKYNGEALACQLQAGVMYSDEQRRFMVRVLGKYLMRNAKVLDFPTKDDKIQMARAIVTTYPILKSDTDLAYDHFYDPKAFTGHLEWYIRCKRSRDVSIPVAKKRKRPQPIADDEVEEEDAVVIRLRQTKPTASNVSSLRDDMAATRAGRRQWIATCKPSATEVLRRWPRYVDVPQTIHDDFNEMVQRVSDLKAVWTTVQPQILQRVTKAAAGNADLVALLQNIQEEFDEDGKMYVSVMALPHFMVMPPQKGVKKARLSPAAVAKMLLFESKAESITAAVEEVITANILQPVLLRVIGQLYVKLDRHCIPLDVGCLIEAVDVLLQCFYVFNLDFPWPLRATFGFLEDLCGLPITVRNFTVIGSFKRSLR